MATADVLVRSVDKLTEGSVNIPIHQFPTNSGDGPSDPDAVAGEIIKSLNKALESGDVVAVADLFQDDCYWRDHLALSWNYHTLKGRSKLAEFLKDQGCTLKNVEIDNSSPFRKPHYGPLDGTGSWKGVEFFINFTSSLGYGTGIVRLNEQEKLGKWKIFSFFTTLEDLKDYEQSVGPHRPVGVEHGGKPDRKNWLERREAEQNYEDGAEPTVIIMGAGQGGLTIAARLKVLNVNALIVDMNNRIGDNWRNRYHQLVLHDPVWYDHLPFMPFPKSWPIFTPKDKLAQWFETYARSMELNVWMQSTITSSKWDENSKTWTVQVNRTMPDGSKKDYTFRPHHIVQATGHSGKKNFPSHIKGLSNFKGTRLCHSSEFPGAQPNSKGKKAIVVGSCNSGHDIAQTYYENGYDITMVQRSTTCVISSESITEIGLKGLYDENGPPVEDADIWLHGTPSSVLKAIQIRVTELQNNNDKAILDGLTKAGFALDKGPDNAGLFIKYFQRGGGYYIDVGASKLIADGKIKVKQGQEIEEVLPNGLRFADGSVLEADEIIFATGYQNMRTQAREIFGDEVADRVTDIWGFDEEGEMKTMWRPSGHPGFWFMGGNLALCRYYSRLLALQIKAREEGLVK